MEPDYLVYFVSQYWTPLPSKGAETPPIIIRCRGGSRGAIALFKAPPWQGFWGAAPPKLKTDVKLPCKSILISSQSRPLIRQMI